MTEKIFDSSVSEGEVFWEEYCKLEKRRFRKLKRKEDFEPGWSWTYLWEIIFLQRVRNNVDNEFEPVGFVPKIWYWVGRSWRRENYEDEENERAFLLFFLRSIKYIAAIVLSLTFVCLGGMVGLIHIAAGDDAAHASPEFVSWSNGYFAAWLVSIGVCLGFFLYLTIKVPSSLQAEFSLDTYDIWTTIGNFILCVRLYELVRPLSSYFESDEHPTHQMCFGLREQFADESQARFFVVLMLMTDFTMSSVLSILPFQWPWVFNFCAIMIAHTCVRLYTCEDLLDLPESQLLALRLTLYVSLVLSYIGMVIIVSYSFVRTMKSNFINGRHQQALGQDTRKMVDLLCSDVKMTVRSTLKCHHEIFTLTKSVLELQKEQNTLALAGEVIQHAVDMMLFLVKVGEGRHRIIFRDRVHLHSAIEAEVVQFSKAIALYSHGLESMDVRLDIPDCVLMVDSLSVSALIYYGLSAIYSINRCGIEPSQLISPLIFQISVDFRLLGANETVSFPYRMPPDHQLCEMRLVLAREPADSTSKTNVKKNTHPLTQSFHTVLAAVVNLYDGQYTMYPDYISISIKVAIDTNRHCNRPLFPELPATLSGITVASGPSSTSIACEGDSPNNTFRGMAADLDDNAVLARFLYEDCSIFSTVPSVAPLLLDLISQLVLVEGGVLPMTVWHELNVTDIKIRAVVFVQTESGGQRLRDAGYRRSIVLCSEKLAYLDRDHLDTSLFDFVVSLPASAEELQRLRRFLRHAQREAADESAQPTPASDARNAGQQKEAVDVEPGSSSKSIAESVSRIGGTVRRILSAWSNFITVWPIPLNLYDNYARWRFLNPGNDLYHHSTNLEYFSLAIVAWQMVTFVMGYMRVYNFAVVILLSMLLLYRRSFYRFLHPWMTLAALWRACAFVNTALIAVSFLGETVRIIQYHSPLVALDTPPSATLAEMFTKFPANSFQTSKQALAVFISFPMSVRYNTEFFPWPASLWTVILYSVRTFMALETYFKPMMFGWQYYLLVALVSLFFVKSLFVHRETENRMRAEFLQLHRLITSRHFFDACLMITRRVEDGLSVLKSAQAKTMTALVDKILQENILVGHVLLEQIHLLHQQQAILAQLSMELRGADSAWPLSSTPEPFGRSLLSSADNSLPTGAPMTGHATIAPKVTKEDLIAQLRAVVVRPAVHTVCAAFGESIAAAAQFASTSTLVPSRPVLPTASSMMSLLSSPSAAAIMTPSMLVASMASATATGLSVWSTPTALLYVRVDPELLLVRTDVDLLGNVITKLLREAYRQIDEYMAASTAARNVHLASFAASSTASAPTDAKAKAKGTNSVGSDKEKKHQLLLWLKASPLWSDSAQGQASRYRFRDVRRMDVLCFHSAGAATTRPPHADGGGHRLSTSFSTPNDPAQSTFVLRKRPFESSAAQYSASTMHPVNKYLPLFPVPTPSTDCHGRKIDPADPYRRSRATTTAPGSEKDLELRDFYPLFEEGVVEGHGSYRRYQRYTLPYVLTPRSERFVELVRSNPASFQSAAEIVRRLSTRFFPLCRTIYVQHVTLMGRAPVVIGDSASHESSEVSTPWRSKASSRMSSRVSTSSTEKSAPRARLTSTSVLDPTLAAATTAAHLHAVPGASPSAVAGSAATATTTGAVAAALVRPRFTGRCSLYCQPYGFLNTTERSALLTLMRLTQWAVIHYHPDPLPAVSSYQHSECILIEYQPPPVPEGDRPSLMRVDSLRLMPVTGGGTNTRPNNVQALEIWLEQRRQAWHADQARTYAYDVVELMHFVRVEGFVGVIVVLLPSTMDETEEEHIRRDVACSNVYREAVRADLCIKLPLDHEKIQQLVATCERRLVELSLSVSSTTK